MKKRGRGRESHKKRSSLLETRSLDGSDLANVSAHTMRRRLDAIIRETRDRHFKLKEEGKFAFLKRSLGSSSVERDAVSATQKRKATFQPKRSNIRSREATVLQAAESLDMGARVEQTVSDFIRCAWTGDRIIVTKLFAIAVEIIRALNLIAMKMPEVVLPISRKSIFWPGLIGRKRFIKQMNERMVKSIQLGSGDTFTKRGWQLFAPSTQAALDLFLTSHDFQQDWNLPPLTEENKKTWFEFAWQQILNEGIVPEEIPWLAPVGRSAVGKRSISRGMPNQTEGMKRDDVRAEIKRQVWNAFDKLVAGAAEKSK